MTKESLELVEAYVEAKLKIVELENEIKKITTEKEDVIKLSDFRKWLYVSTDEDNAWVEKKHAETVVKILLEA